MKKYDSKTAKKRKVQFFVLMILGYGISLFLPKFISPVTPLEVGLYWFARISSFITAILAAMGMLAILISELDS